MTKTDRKLLLRPWLRSKSIHPADIAATFLWLDEERRAGREPTDQEILCQADQCHENAVNAHVRVEPTQLMVRYQLSWKIVFYAAIGAFLGDGLWVLAQILLASLLAD